MAWRVLPTVVDAKRQFLLDYEREPTLLASLCDAHNIGRSTAYDLIARFRSEGLEAAIMSRSRAPIHVHNRLSAEAVERILCLRTQTGYGPRKLETLYEWFFREEPPSRPSIANVLREHNLVRDYQRRRGKPTANLTVPRKPNDVWSADFKGTMRKLRAEPLNLVDLSSRFWLLCDPFAGTDYQSTRAAFDRAFNEYGVPRVLRVDGGVPWAAPTPSRLTDLSAWFVRLGIAVEFVPRCQDNGRIERLHGTIERELDRPKSKAGGLRAFFESARVRYNEFRPHQSLEMETPASAYVKSRRRPIERKPDYENCDLVRRLDRRGYLWWRGDKIFICQSIARKEIGFHQLAVDRFGLRYHHHTVGILDTQGKRLRAA